MRLIAGRYNRSGYAPTWFYAAICIGFAAMTVWALIQADWIVAGIAAGMVPLTFAGGRLMRRLGEAARASRQQHEEDRR